MTKYIVANWKMNGDLKLIKAYADLVHANPIKSHLIVCPPATYIWSAIGAGYDVGAQDCHQNEHGAYTGNISAQMLHELGCKYVIIGHSERRIHQHETDAQIHKKAEVALKNKLIPIICIGESIEDRENEETLAVLKAQLETACPKLDEGFIVAYEPVWAIGTGKTATPKDIECVHAMIREHVGPKIPILYGGSVNSENAYTILDLANVDGVLVGGASLKTDEILAIIKSDHSEHD